MNQWNDPELNAKLEVLIAYKNSLQSCRDSAAEQLATLYAQAKGDSRRAWATIISQNIGALLPDLGDPSSVEHRDAALLWLQALAKTQTIRPSLGDSTEWLSKQKFDSIVDECMSNAPDSIGSGHVSYGYDVTEARAVLSETEEFFDWAEHLIGKKLSRQLGLTYLHYSMLGQKCPAHIDDPLTYEYNCIVGLRAKYESPHLRSALRIYFGDECLDFRLDDRTAIVFGSANCAHGRTPLAKNESAYLLSIGLVSY